MQLDMLNSGDIWFDMNKVRDHFRYHCITDNILNTGCASNLLRV